MQKGKKSEEKLWERRGTERGRVYENKEDRGTQRSNEIVHERPVFKKLQTFLMLYFILL